MRPSVFGHRILGADRVYWSTVATGAVHPRSSSLVSALFRGCCSCVHLRSSAVQTTATASTDDTDELLMHPSAFVHPILGMDPVGW